MSYVLGVTCAGELRGCIHIHEERMEASTGVSYEQLRMEKLRRNQELMHSLGLTQSAASMPQASDRKSKATPRKKRVIENDETTPSGTRRRSPRLSGETPVSASTPGTDAAESEMMKHLNCLSMPLIPLRF